MIGIWRAGCQERLSDNGWQLAKNLFNKVLRFHFVGYFAGQVKVPCTYMKHIINFSCNQLFMVFIFLDPMLAPIEIES